MELEKIINELGAEESEEVKKVVTKIVEKIMELPMGEETNIAKLIDYDSYELVDPLTQGIVSNLVDDVCEKLGIVLQENRDSFGGLAYYYNFKRIK